MHDKASNAVNMIQPGATLGVMGGGQLGRMFVHAAQSMGYNTAVLDPDPSSPAGLVSHHHIQTDYQDPQGLALLTQCASAITTEFENVPASALLELASDRPVAPGGKAVAVCQDRIDEKAFFVDCHVPCAPYAVIQSEQQVAEADAALFPGILKTARMGYDGKGQVRVTSRETLQAAWQNFKQVPCVLEQLLPLHAEISVLVVRGQRGEVVHFPVQQNLHRDGILAVTTVPAQGISQELQQQAVASAERLAASLDYVGVLCVEFFVLTDGRLMANEMAPRPHNSGHHTLDSCTVSQFEMQVRAMTGMPLVKPRLHSPCLMLNLLGDLWFTVGSKEMQTPDWSALLSLSGVHLHLYGKTQARPGRKMGHITVTGCTPDQVHNTALKVAGMLGMALS